MVKYKKAQMISLIWLKLIDTFILNQGQGLAGKLTSFKSVLKHYENDNNIIIGSITSHRLRKSAIKGGV